MKIIHRISLLCLAATLGSCFTGVESTPRISDNDVRRQKIHVTPEESFAQAIKGESPAQWHQGKRFVVTDPKISRIFVASQHAGEFKAGDEIELFDICGTENLAGTGATNFTFMRPDTPAAPLHYVVDIDSSSMCSRSSFVLPFAVEKSVIALADSLMRGNTYYIMTGVWCTPDSNREFDALRYVQVRVDSVSCGTAVYPLAIDFTTVDCHEGTPRQGRVLLTYGTDRSATRNFPAAFAFENPRKAYPDITNDHWQSIMHSRVQTGMTRDECRLAMGSPKSTEQIPTTAGMLERWSYDDGVYMIFEDGYLTRYRK